MAVSVGGQAGASALFSKVKGGMRMGGQKTATAAASSSISLINELLAWKDREVQCCHPELSTLNLGPSIGEFVSAGLVNELLA